MSEATTFVSKYFEPLPPQLGYRGDPHLWNEMQAKTIETKIPSTQPDFTSLLHNLFFELTGGFPLTGKSIYQSKYDTGGMSRGMISCDFWLEKAFPLLIARYEADHPLPA